MLCFSSKMGRFVELRQCRCYNKTILTKKEKAMGQIIVVGLGSNVGQLSADALEALKSSPVLFKTDRYPAYAWAINQGLNVQSLDKMYES